MSHVSPARRLVRLVRAMAAWRSGLILAGCLVAVFVVGAPGAAHAQADRRPCDIFKKAGTPCVAAHSTTRALFADYWGPLYQVQRASDGRKRDVVVTEPGGYAHAVTQDNFCAGTTCRIVILYDQTKHHNDIMKGIGGGNGGIDIGAAANALRVTAGGNQVYALATSPGVGYRNDATAAIPTGGQPQGVYMVTSGTHVNNGCCFDYGNAETSNFDTGNGHMDAVYFGTLCWFGCTGPGPWVLADLENGLFASGTGVVPTSVYPSLATVPFVTAWLKNNGQNAFELRYGDGQKGHLKTLYSGALPKLPQFFGYTPMQQEGAIILGVGGDNSNGSAGNFFEGVITQGVPSDAAEEAVQANIVAVGYGGPTGFRGRLSHDSEISVAAKTPCCTTHYWSYADASEALTPVSVASTDTVKLAATWIVRRGLADPTCFSFEQRNRPGDFLRHFAFVLHTGIYDGSAGFAADATFCAVPGLNGSGTSFRSYNYPDRFIRHFDFGLVIASNGGPNAFDSSFSYADDTSRAVQMPWAY